MSKLIPDALDAPCQRIITLSVAVETFKLIFDILRHNSIDYLSTDVATAYALVTDNKSLFTTIKAHPAVVNNMRPELERFVCNRIIHITECVCEMMCHMHKPSILKSTVLRPIEFSGKTYPPSVPMDMRELRLVEFDILRNCEIALSYEPDRTMDQTLANSQLPPMLSIFRWLMSIHQAAADLNQRSGRFAHVVYRPNVDNDMCSSHVLVTLGHTLAHVAQAIVISSNRYDDDFVRDRNKSAQQLIYDKFTEYSNLGSMTIAGIVCCFGNLDVLPAVVVDEKHHLGTLERELLEHVMILTTLTNECLSVK